MANEGIILTPEGRAKLEEERHYLETVKRAEVGERIRVAREFGDISENSEFDDAKNEQGRVEARIDEINRILSEATSSTDAKRTRGIGIGKTAVVEMNGVERTFTIVGTNESDVANGKIANDSPVGTALMGKKKGDTAEFVGPTGKKITLKVVRIEK